MKTITAIILTIIVLTTATAFADVGDRGEFYPRLTVCTACAELGDSGCFIYDCVDMDGNVWSFYGEENDYQVGDLLNLLMWNMGEEEEADEIIEIYYEGTINMNDFEKWIEE